MSTKFRPCMRLAILLILPCAAAAACGGTTSSGAGTDTSTNWLKLCSEQAECDLGSTCACGRCTRECVTSGDCAVFAADAVCEPAANACAGTLLCMPAAASSEPSSETGSASCAHEPDDYILSERRSCFGRELPECPPGSEPFFDACGCGCSAAPDYPRACRTNPCESTALCGYSGFEEYPDYAATLADWAQSEAYFSTVGAGECEGGRRFIFRAGPFSTEARFFGAGGAFMGLSSASDGLDATCLGQRYWPEPVRCEQATVTELSRESDSSVEVGTVLRLPWAEGPPERPL